MITSNHKIQMEESDISLLVANKCGVYSEVNAGKIEKILRRPLNNVEKNQEYLVFPYFSMQDRNKIVTYSVRPDKPTDPKNKYYKVRGDRNYLYVPKILTKEDFQDVSKPIFITEGEKKAICGASHGYIVVSVGGVWSWKTKNKDGDSITLPEFSQINFKNRKTYIVFDSDWLENWNIYQSVIQLSRFLKTLGAEVYCVCIQGE